MICVDHSLIYVLDTDLPLFCIGTVISRTNGVTVRYEHRGASDRFDKEMQGISNWCLVVTDQTVLTGYHRPKVDSENVMVDLRL
ncbi:hypothetical protein H5410_024574 [Solanum commersonii]|uniref:Uncharacterized protein n=1 Tax=Solanum commersonii TaxID=4109 RepID=A0A9J5ZMB3_SOLCO|nr:hypothetical protein H5410_024574 [Solanum commersonii]